MTTNELATTDDDGVRNLARVVESLVLRGDVSALDPAERARFYIKMCNDLGLNPNAQPFTFLRLNGKEILYAGKGCTDQLAAIHRVTRRMVVEPKLVDLGGTKLIYAVCEASLPNGRVETATATVPFTDPVNVLMKCETKAKRRATMSILGLAILDEMELETIPSNVQGPAAQVDLGAATAPASVTAEVIDETTGEVSDAPVSEDALPPAMEAFYLRIGEIELPGEAAKVWMKHRTELAPLPVADREAAWKALCRRTEEVGKMKNAKVWLKKAIAEEDQRRASAGPTDHQAA